MTAVEKYFFTPIYRPDSPVSIIKWWEARRPLYNLAVGAAGLLSVGTVAVLEMLPPMLRGVEFPLLPILVFGVMANVGFTFGAPADLMLRRLFGERAAAAGPAIFRYGFVFSIGLALLPIPVSIIGYLFRLFLP